MLRRPLTPKITVGQMPKFEYSTTGVPADGWFRLQRRLTDGTWKRVASARPGTNKIIYAPAPSPLGKYTYRMQARSSSKVLLAQTAHNHDVYAYGNVSVQTLCPHMSDAGSPGSRACVKNNTVVGGTNLITWMAVAAAVHPQFSAGAKYDQTSCRSTALTFTNKRNSSTTAWLEAVQPGHSTQVASAGHSQIGHLNATLYGGQVYLNGSLESGNDGVYVGGTMSCWTTTGTY